jgi:hypothetical protein
MPIIAVSTINIPVTLLMISPHDSTNAVVTA